MEPRLVELPRRHYVGLGTRFVSILSPQANGMHLIPRLWDAFLPRVGEVPGVVGSATYGLCSALPADADRAHADEHHYLAAVEVEDPARAPAEMERRTVAGGAHLVYTHVGPLAGLAETMRRIYEVWLPASGHALREAPQLEIYDERFDPSDPASALDIAIPVQR